MGVRDVDVVQNSGMDVAGLLSALAMLVLLVVVCVVFYKFIKKLLDR